MRRSCSTLAAFGASFIAACAGESGSGAPRTSGGLLDASVERGIAFSIRRGGDDHFMPDSMGPGCALFDADGDGDLDAFFVQGLRGADGGLASDAGRDRLLLQGADGRFRDASGESGLDDPRYGMGVAVADVDSDGDLDVFVTNFGSSRLYLNRGDGTFLDFTEASGIVEEGWASSAGFCDYDADGRPDLFVARYLEFDLTIRGAGGGGAPDFPSPLQFKGLPGRLWHNEGGGLFRDVSAESGIASVAGRGLGLGFLDLNDDGRQDIFVANDSEPNFAWIQTEPGRFEEQAFPLGLAVNRVGRPQANMGVAIGDVEGDGTAEIFVTHLVSETNVLYRRQSARKYADMTAGSGLGASSLDKTGFGTAFADLENDGDLDLLVVNGRILRRGPRGVAPIDAHWLPYAEENQLYLNSGSGKFELASGEQGGDWSQALAVGRAVAVGDVDQDGGLDALVSNGDGSCRLYVNQIDRRGNYIRVRALDSEGRCDLLGARVEVSAGDQRWSRTIETCVGYLSAQGPSAHFGLGASASIDSIVVNWPGGGAEKFPGGPVNCEVRLRKGSGTH